MAKGVEFAALAFFKSAGIKYYPNGNFIDFPCFHCGVRTKMNVYSTFWNCVGCLQSGNLLDLDDMLPSKIEQVRALDLVNPRKEKNDINLLIRKLLKQVENKQHEKDLKTIQTKISKLFSYYAENHADSNP